MELFSKFHCCLFLWKKLGPEKLTNNNFFFLTILVRILSVKQICFFQEEQKYSKDYKIKSIFLAASRTWKKQRNWSTSCFESNQYFKSVCLILRQVKYILIYHLVLLSRALKLSLELRNRVWFFGAYYLLFFLLIWHSLASNGLYCSFYLHIIYQKLSYVANFVGFSELYWPFGCLSRYLSALGFWNIEFEKSSLMN